jgi:hypothetical protein
MPIRFLVAAHIKKRSECTNEEKRDFENVVAAMCSFGCDELFERGVIVVSDEKIIRIAVDPLLEKADCYIKSLVGRRCPQATGAAAKYFEWHRRHHLGVET